MTNVTVTQEFDLSTTEIWKIVGDPYNLASWMESVQSVSQKGDLREIRAHNGASFVERIFDHSDSKQMYSYEYLEGPLEVEYYLATFRVEGSGARSKITWAASFAAKTNTPEAEHKLENSIENMYRSVLRNFAEAQMLNSP